MSFSDDNALSRDLLQEACRREGVVVWAYCLMPNHVHLILTPRTPEGLARALGKAHRRYSAFVNPDAGDWPSFSGALFPWS